MLEPTKTYGVRAPPGSAARSSFLSAYDLSIELNGKYHLEIGRFSQSALRSLKLMIEETVPVSTVVQIGAFCQFAEDAAILLGGSHRNENLLNVTFGDHQLYKSFMSPQDKDLCSSYLRAGITVGDGVVVSSRAMLFDGAQIGAGTVVGANTFVATDCDAFSIYAGSPARKVRERLDSERQHQYITANLPFVAAHAVPQLPSVMTAFQTGTMSPDEMRARLPLMDARPKVHVGIRVDPSAPNSKFEFQDFSIGGKRVPDGSERDTLFQYFAQYNSDRTDLNWSPDVFLGLGLTRILQ